MLRQRLDAPHGIRQGDKLQTAGGRVEALLVVRTQHPLVVFLVGAVPFVVTPATARFGHVVERRLRFVDAAERRAQVVGAALVGAQIERKVEAWLDHVALAVGNGKRRLHVVVDQIERRRPAFEHLGVEQVSQPADDLLVGLGLVVAGHLRKRAHGRPPRAAAVALAAHGHGQHDVGHGLRRGRHERVGHHAVRDLVDGLVHARGVHARARKRVGALQPDDLGHEGLACLHSVQ